MAYIEWSPEYSVGVEVFDNQHKKLVEIVNNLHESMLKGKSRSVMAEILDELIQYTVEHFQTEESLFDQHGYPKESEHRHQHKTLTDQVVAFRNEFLAGTTMISIGLLEFLRKWLVEHMQGADMAYKGFFNENGVK